MKQFREIPTLNFGDAIRQAANHIVRFNGRARRSEYWWTQLLVFGISFFLTPMGGLIAELVLVPLTFRRLHDTGKSGWWWSVGAILSALYFILLLSDIASFISFIANGVFSKIDIDAYTPLNIIAALVEFYGKYLLILIGIIMWRIVLLIFMCQDSDREENQYGKSPKYVDAEMETRTESEAATE